MTYDIDEHDPDWSKRLSLHHPLNTEEGFRRWMRESGKTGSDVRRMALYSEWNRVRYPWLQRVVSEDD
jgi:hypothetical protein